MAVEQAVPGALDEADPDAPAVKQLAAALAPDEVQLAYSMCLHGRAELGLAPDEYSGLVMVLLRLLAFRPGGSPRAVTAPTNSPASESKAAPSATPAAATAAPTSAALLASRPATVSRPVVATAAAAAPKAPEPPAWVEEAAPWDDDSPSSAQFAMQNTALAAAPTLAPLPAPQAAPNAALVTTAQGERWMQVVQALLAAGTVQALVRELALQAQCVAVDEQNEPMLWRLQVERETLRSPAHVEKLQTAVAQHLGRAVRLEVQAGAAQDNPALRLQAEKDRLQREAEAMVHDDPLVRDVMSQFKSARIVPGSIRRLA
jgi:DNA polymerase-3 subunit gamma/tau